MKRDTQFSTEFSTEACVLVGLRATDTVVDMRSPDFEAKLFVEKEVQERDRVGPAGQCNEHSSADKAGEALDEMQMERRELVNHRLELSVVAVGGLEPPTQGL